MLLEQQLGLALERLPQVVVEVGKLVLVGHDVAQVAQLQPLPGEVADQRRGARVGQHPPHLPLEHRRRRCSRPCAAAVSSSSSGMLLHRKNDRRDASSRSLMR